MTNIWKNYYFFSKTQSSIISDYFFWIEKHTFNCFQCGTYYNHSMKNLFIINLDKVRVKRDSEIPCKNGTNLDLYYILNYYFSKFKTKCKSCKCEGKKDIKILINTKILIIVFDRKNHNNNFKGDINFDINIDLKNYFSENKSIDNDYRASKYSLKTYICFNGVKYLSYCYINFTNDKNNDVLYRFIDDDVIKVKGIKELYDFEPQILIYEIQNESKANTNNSKYINYMSINTTKVCTDFDQNRFKTNTNNIDNNNQNNKIISTIFWEK